VISVDRFTDDDSDTCDKIVDKNWVDGWWYLL